MIREELIEEGIVLKSEKGIAEVSLAENEECEECSAKLFCKPGENNTKTIKAFDPYDSKPGDSVRISVAGNAILKATVILYGIPLVILILTIWVGLIMFSSYSSPELISFLIALALMGIYYLAVYYYGKKHKGNLNLARIITVHRHN